MEAIAEGGATGLLSPNQIARIELQNEDILCINCKAHLVYLANYAFSESFTQQIGRRVLASPKAANLIYVVTIRPFEDPGECGLDLVDELECEMSWTPSQRVYVYKRKMS